MANIDEATRALQDAFDAKQTRLKFRAALAGDGGGTVDVADDPGFIWCRYSADQSKVSKVFNLIAPGVPEDFPLTVGKRFPDDEYEQVLAINWTLYQKVITQDTVDGFTTGNHGESHNAADGNDPAPIDLRNIVEMRGRAQATPDLTVFVEEGQFIFGDEVKRFISGSIDLTAAVPGVAGHRYVLVYVDGVTNALGSTNGTIVPLINTPPIPTVTANTIPICLAQLAQNQTTIDEDDLFDWRFLWQLFSNQAPALIGTNAERVALTVADLAELTRFYTTDTDKIWDVWEGAWRLLYPPAALSESDGDAGTPWTTDAGGKLTGSEDLILDDDSLDSPLLVFRGGSNNDEVWIFLDDDAVAGDSDLVISLVDAAGDSKLVINDSGGNAVITFDSNGGAVFNENSEDADFRIEGNGEINLLFVDAGNDRVGIGTNAPTSKLEIFLGNDALRLFGAFPGFWMQESGVGEKSAYFVLDADIFQVQRRATNYGALIAVPFSIDMDATENTLRIIPGEFVVNENGTNTVDFRVEGDANPNLIFTDSVNDRVGIGTGAPGQIFDVNQGSGNMIADGYDTHSLAAWKEELTDIDIDIMLENILAVPPKQWKRTPFVSTAELVQAAWEYFDIPKEDRHDERGYLRDLKDNEILDWIDARREELRIERLAWPMYQRLHYGLVADDPITILQLPEIISRDPDINEPCGISLSSYVGALHAAVIALSNQVDLLMP